MKKKTLQDLNTKALTLEQTQKITGKQVKKHCRKKYQKRGNRWVCYTQWH